ncbi:autotransporter domain-containing protein [uncultured Kordia sp.]|uniref:autotransporter domain-containing protein n=1 Tax=uncultured Kordia sp. TaxID=507699 RepID=UPI0026369B34|nr:autotransporter domain-containing protein [uncultured Kordia sp.]
MKKITLFVCLFTIAFVNAQDADKTTSDKLSFEKGTQFVNLNFSVNSSETNFERQTQDQLDTGETKAFGFSINASYAHAINNNLFLGLGVGYGSNKNEATNIDGSVNENDSKSYQVFPYVRYYKGIGKKLALFIQGEARYSHFENELNALNDGESDNFFVGIRPGITFMLNKNFALETSFGALGYTHSKIDNGRFNTEATSNSFNLSLNSSNLFFGLNYYF